MRSTWIFALLVLCIGTPFAFADQPNPYVGRWAFELSDGNPVWLEIAEGAGSGRLLWSVGSAKPVSDISFENGRLSFSRKMKWKPFGEPAEERLGSETFEATVEGDEMELKTTQRRAAEGSPVEEVVLRGKRLPSYPSKPNLSEVTFAEPRALLAKDSLEGWILSNPKKKNGWRVEEGILINETPKEDFSAYGEFGNLITEEEFEDFRLTIEYNVPKAGNSGIYLRGMYEAQVVDRDSRMQGINGPGAIFGRLVPSQNAANEGGEWNRYVLTLVDQHITVELNGKVVIDNVLLEGCTGGGISADDTAPGPLFLQGDHTSVRYRNIQIQEVKK